MPWPEASDPQLIAPPKMTRLRSVRRPPQAARDLRARTRVTGGRELKRREYTSQQQYSATGSARSWLSVRGGAFSMTQANALGTRSAREVAP
jgi:hypothetical protein